MKALITGVTGFVGSHLAEFLLKKKHEVYGTFRWRSRTEHIESMRKDIKLVECDMTDAHSIYRVLKRVKPDYIFHLAAQSFVPTSWKTPAHTMFTNVVGQVNLFEAIRDNDIDPRIQLACCYDDKTKAFTEEGLKKYKKLKIGDKVLSINPRNNNIEYKKIKKVIIDEYKGEMYHFKSKSCDLLVTPNHKLLTKKKKGRNIRFIEAEKISGRNILPLGKIKSKKYYGPKELYYLIGLFIGDGYITPCKKALEWSGLSHNEYIKKRNEKGQFIKINKNKIKEYISNRIFLSIPEKDKARKSAENVLTKLNIKFSKYKSELYFVPSKEILEIFQQCGKYARNKRIPNFLLNSNINYLKELFKGLIDSDGSYRKNRFQYNTISYRLVNDIIELCHKIELWISITKVNERIIYLKKRKIKSSKCYNLSITTGEKILTNVSGHQKKVKYKGTIWCVEVEGNHNLLVERNGKIAFCGNSSEEYGMVHPNEVPIKETNPLRPLSPYGVSKVAQDLLGYQYHQSYGMKIIRTRGFNHTGGRRGDVFVTSNFAKQIAEIESGIKKPIIYVGDLSTVRDFTDVRDMVKGYLLAIEKGVPGEVYNLCSGKGYKIKEVLDILLSYSNVKVNIKKSKLRMRPSDLPILIGDNSKFRKLTGWKPKIKFEDTLKDILDYWREKVKNKQKQKDVYSKI